MWQYIALILFLAAVAGGGVYYYYNYYKKSGNPTPAPAPPAPAPPPFADGTYRCLDGSILVLGNVNGVWGLYGFDSVDTINAYKNANSKYVSNIIQLPDDASCSNLKGNGYYWRGSMPLPPPSN